MKTNDRIRILTLVLLLETALLLTLVSAHFLKKSFLPGKIFDAAAEHAKHFTVLNKFSFENQASLKNWEEKVFKGKTAYQVLTENSQGFLNSSSAGASSGLYIKLSREVTPNLYLSWRWRAITFPQKKHPERLANRSEDDFAARIYVIFPGSNFFNTNVIEYIWDENINAGSAESSPYSDRIKLFVIRSGKGAEIEGGWQTEERNIYQDYLKLFGKEPKRPIGAVAIMSDSDNTGTTSQSDFGEIVFKAKQKIADLPINETTKKP